jgi:glycosyltransferase involved in cell wall biosynthesis
MTDETNEMGELSVTASNDKRDDKIDVSVIVPVWNDRVRLKRCLEALASQTMSKARFEVVVVDNGSTDGSDELAAAQPGILFLREMKPGSYHARNRGLTAARGEFVAFTDSDCIPEPDWLEQGVEKMRDRRMAIVGAGRVILFVEEGATAEARPSRAALAYERAFSFDQRRNAARGVCVTANMIASREAVLEVGGFDALRKSGGDYDLCRRLERLGLKTVYLDDVRVAHPVRASLSALRQKRRRLVGGSWTTENGGKRAPAILYGIAHATLNKLGRALLRNQAGLFDRFLAMFVVIVLSIEGVAELSRLMLGGRPER